MGERHEVGAIVARVHTGWATPAVDVCVEKIECVVRPAAGESPRDACVRAMRAADELRNRTHRATAVVRYQDGFALTWVSNDAALQTGLEIRPHVIALFDAKGRRGEVAKSTGRYRSVVEVDRALAKDFAQRPESTPTPLQQCLRSPADVGEIARHRAPVSASFTAFAKELYLRERHSLGPAFSAVLDMFSRLGLDDAPDALEAFAQKVCELAGKDDGRLASVLQAVCGDSPLVERFLRQLEASRPLDVKALTTPYACVHTTLGTLFAQIFNAALKQRVVRSALAHRQVRRRAWGHLLGAVAIGPEGCRQERRELAGRDPALCCACRANAR